MLFDKPLVDAEFYKNNYFGESVEDEDWNRLESQAEDQINTYCYGWFDNHTLDEFPANHFNLRIQKAVCAQIEYFNELGGATEMSAQLNDANSATIGNFSYSGGNASLQKGTKALTCEKALNYLRPTGLLYGGVQ